MRTAMTTNAIADEDFMVERLTIDWNNKIHFNNRTWNFICNLLSHQKNYMTKLIRLGNFQFLNCRFGFLIYDFTFVKCLIEAKYIIKRKSNTLRLWLTFD